MFESLAESFIFVIGMTFVVLGLFPIFIRLAFEVLKSYYEVRFYLTKNETQLRHEELVEIAVAEVVSRG